MGFLLFSLGLFEYLLEFKQRAHITTLMLLLIFRVLRHMLSKSERGKTSAAQPQDIARTHLSHLVWMKNQAFSSVFHRFLFKKKASKRF